MRRDYDWDDDDFKPRKPIEPEIQYIKKPLYKNAWFWVSMTLTVVIVIILCTLLPSYARMRKLQKDLEELQALADEWNALADSFNQSSFGDSQQPEQAFINIGNESGNTEDGDNIIIYVEENSYGEYLDLTIKNYDGSLITYIYVDDAFVKKGQYSNTYTSVDLKDDQLSIGNHTVKAVQYDNNEESGNIVNSDMKEYEVRAL